MPIVYVKRYERHQLQSNPQILVVFGDNLARRGFRGQAAEARGEPNAVGLPTKRYPANNDSAFLNDNDLEEIKLNAAPGIKRLAEHLMNGGTVIWPTDGIGTGLARLPEKAPKIHAWYEDWRKKLQAINPDQG